MESQAQTVGHTPTRKVVLCEVPISPSPSPSRYVQMMRELHEQDAQLGRVHNFHLAGSSQYHPGKELFPTSPAKTAPTEASQEQENQPVGSQTIA